MKTEEEYAEYEKRIQEARERKKNRRKEWLNCELEAIFTPIPVKENERNTNN